MSCQFATSRPYNNAEEDYVVATNVVPDHDVPDSKTAVNIKWYNA